MGKITAMVGASILMSTMSLPVVAFANSTSEQTIGYKVSSAARSNQPTSSQSISPDTYKIRVGG